MTFHETSLGYIAGYLEARDRVEGYRKVENGMRDNRLVIYSCMQGELDVEIQQSMAVKGSPCTRASASDGNGFIPKTFTMTVRTGQ